MKIKPAQHHVEPKKKKEHEPAHALFAAHLVQAQLPSLAPHKPHAAAAAPKAPRIEAPRTEAPRLAAAPAPKESSAQPAALFTLPTEPTRVEQPAIAAPVPSFVPKELVADDTARLVLFPHQMNFVTEGQRLNLQVRNGEVSIRAQGELAASLKSNESELRIALAQEGLKLKETDFSEAEQHEDDRRHERQEREWT